MAATCPQFDERAPGRRTMTAVAAEPEVSEAGAGVPQYRLPMILFMFAWPAAWFMFLIWVVAPALFGTPAPGEFLPTWRFVGIATAGNAAELLVALVVLRREGYRLTLRDLHDRARLRWPRGRRQWGLVPGALALYAVGVAAAPLNRALAAAPGFVPPAWWPPITNPTVEVAAPAELFPDLTLAGNYLFLAAYLLYATVFNVVGEELYYRGVLLPKMRGVFGRWDWVANGLLFTLKHVYQL
jgi:membrane protease YdiL (CAAX protease family)